MKKLKPDTKPVMLSLGVQPRKSAQVRPQPAFFAAQRVDWRPESAQPQRSFFQNMKNELTSIKNDVERLIKKDTVVKPCTLSKGRPQPQSRSKNNSAYLIDMNGEGNPPPIQRDRRATSTRFGEPNPQLRDENEHPFRDSPAFGEAGMERQYWEYKRYADQTAHAQQKQFGASNIPYANFLSPLYAQCQPSTAIQEDSLNPESESSLFFDTPQCVSQRPSMSVRPSTAVSGKQQMRERAVSFEPTETAQTVLPSPSIARIGFDQSYTVQSERLNEGTLSTDRRVETELTKEIERWESEYNAIKEQLAGLQKQHAVLHGQKEELERHAASVEQQRLVSQHSIATLGQECEYANSLLREKESMLMTCTAQLADLQRALAMADQQQQAFSVRIAELQADNQNLFEAHQSFGAHRQELIARQQEMLKRVQSDNKRKVDFLAREIEQYKQREQIYAAQLSKVQQAACSQVAAEPILKADSCVQTDGQQSPQTTKQRQPKDSNDVSDVLAIKVNSGVPEDPVGEVYQLRNAVALLQAKQEKAQITVSMLEQEIAMHDANRQASQTQRQLTSCEWEALMDQIDTLRAENKALSDQYEKRVLQLEVANAQKAANLEASHGDKSDTSVDNAALREMLQEVVELRAALNELGSQNRSLATQVDHLRQQVSHFEAATQGWREASKATQQPSAQLARKHAQLTELLKRRQMELRCRDQYIQAFLGARIHKLGETQLLEELKNILCVQQQ